MSYSTITLQTAHTSSRGGRFPAWIVVHTTEGNSTLANAAKYLQQNVERASAHELAGDGIVYVMANDNVATHHAGINSRLPTGETNHGVNLASWGIEIHNRSGVPPSNFAYRIAVDRIAKAAKRLNIPVDRIIAHRAVAPGHRADPTGVNMDTLRADVAALMAPKPPAEEVPKVSREAAARAAWRVEALARASRGDAGAAEALRLAIEADGPHADIHDALVALALPPLYEARDR